MKMHEIGSPTKIFIWWQQVLPNLKSKVSNPQCDLENNFDKNSFLAEVAWIPWKGNRGPTVPKNQENERAFLRKMALGGI